MKKHNFPSINKFPFSIEMLIIGSATILLSILGLIVYLTAKVDLGFIMNGVSYNDLTIPLIVTSICWMIASFRRTSAYNISIGQHIQIKADLQKARGHLDLILTSSPAMLFNAEAKDNFNLHYISENVTRILGYSIVEALAPCFWGDNIHPTEITCIKHKLNELQKAGSGSFEYRFKHKNGTWLWLFSEVKISRDNKGNAIEFVGTIWDVTKTKVGQESVDNANKRFELSYRATKNVIFDLDMNTYQAWVSDELYTSFLYDKETTIMSFDWWKEHIHPLDHRRIIDSINKTLELKTDYWVEEYRFRKGDGTYANIFGNGYILYSASGQPIRWIGAMTDITVFKVNEDALRTAKEKAEESMKAKSEFLANMSHEIRTPLNGMISMLEMTLETNLSDEQKRYLNIVKKSSDILLSLINEILDFSKIDAGKLELSSDNFSLREELPAILQSTAFKAAEKNIEFICNVEPNVPDVYVADLFRIQQILTNLTANALKFTEKGEIALRIQLKSRSPRNATLLFTVADSGIGIATENLKFIFDDFKQADGSTTRKYGGTGLGLAISKRLIEMMGGDIWVESKEGTGSCFSFTLNLQLDPEAGNILLPLNAVEGIKILVVEDNKTSRDTICKMLIQLKMLPFAVDNGEDALLELAKAAVADNRYRIILLDISLAGDIDGFQVAEQIKERGDLSHTSIIVITMSQKQDDRQRFATLGINNFSTKPLSLHVLYETIQNVIANKPVLITQPLLPYEN